MGSNDMVNRLASMLLEGGDEPPKVLDCLVRLYREDIRRARLWYCLQMFATLCTPVTVLLLMSWLSAIADDRRLGDGSSSQKQSDGSFGAVLVAVLCVACVSSFLALDRFQWCAQTAGIAARQAFCSALYRAVVSPELLLDSSQAPDTTRSSSSSSSSSSRRTANAAAAAVGRVEAALVQSVALVNLFEARVALLLQPVEVACILLLLAVITGWMAALAAIGAALFGVAVSAASESRIEAAGEALGQLAAARGQLLHEVVGCMRGVKLNGWELRFGERIEALRRAEAPTAIRRGCSSPCVLRRHQRNDRRHQPHRCACLLGPRPTVGSSSSSGSGIFGAFRGQQQQQQQQQQWGGRER